MFLYEIPFFCIFLLCPFLFPLLITLVLLVQIFHLRKNWNFKTSVPHTPSFLETIESIIKMNRDSGLNNVTCKSSLHTQLVTDFEWLLYNTDSHVLFVVNINLLTFFLEFDTGKFIVLLSKY